MEAPPPPGWGLVESLDKKLLVLLRDSRKILGILRSFDQFANLVLEKAVERTIVGTSYCDDYVGLYVVRGENVVLFGEIDEAKEVPEGLKRVSKQEIKELLRARQEEHELRGSIRSRFAEFDFFD